jgi:hypothetical protein
VTALPAEAMDLEWVILADSAQVVGNKLYLLGGGWDVVNIGQPFPVQHAFAIALSFRVPWQQTNQRHAAEVRIIAEDQQEVARVGAQMEVGSPVGIRPGQAQRIQMAMNLMLMLPRDGIYEIRISINGEEQPRRASFSTVVNPLFNIHP